MNNIITTAASSTSSLYGNVGCAIRELILEHFPDGFFNYVNMSTELPFRNFKRVFVNNPKGEFHKRVKPYIIIRPTYQVSDPDSFGQEIPLTKNINHIQMNSVSGYLFDVLFDRENGYDMKFKLNRDRIEYDVSITVSTLHQQLDLYKAMVNQMYWNSPFTHETALESVIPKTMIYYMGQMCHIDIRNHPELVPMLLHRLNSLSIYPITYKIRNSSAIEEFYMYYTHKTIVTFSDLTINEGSRRNMIEDSFEITFKVSIDFNLPGLYVLSGPPKKISELRTSLSVTGPSKLEANETVSDFIPLFTVSNLFNRYPMHRDGLILYASTIFHLEPQGKDREDKITISSMFDEDRLNAIRLHLAYNQDIATIMKIIVLRNQNELIENADYTVDWNTLSVELKNIDKFDSYRAVIYINNTLMNSTIQGVTDDENPDKQAPKSNTEKWESEIQKIESITPPDDDDDDDAPEGHMMSMMNSTTDGEYPIDTPWSMVISDDAYFFILEHNLFDGSMVTVTIHTDELKPGIFNVVDKWADVLGSSFIFNASTNLLFDSTIYYTV